MAPPPMTTLSSSPEEQLARLLGAAPPGVWQAALESALAREKFGSTAEAAHQSLAEFTRQMWPVIEPGTPLVWNWHLDIMCEELEQQARGIPEHRKLAFFVPPGSMKSILVSVMAPAWRWLDKPSLRDITLANASDLATRDSRRMRDVIRSKAYRDLAVYCAKKRGDPEWGLAQDQNTKVNFENTQRGFRQCLSLGASIMGKRGDNLIIDDPHDAKEVVLGSIEQVGKRLEEARAVFEKVLPTRVNNLRLACWTLIMQRVAEQDLGAAVIAEGDWRVVTIQMEFEPGNPANHPKDPRTREGELMFPDRFPADEVEKLKRQLDNDYSAQCQQRPKPRGGGSLKRWYWRFWYPRGSTPPPPVRVIKPDGSLHECVQIEIPETLTEHTQSWDMAFKSTKASAFVAGQVWARRKADHFMLDQIREKLDINGSIDAVRMMTKRHPAAIRKLVEDKANGPAIVGILRNEIAGFDEVNPRGGKEARMNAASVVAKSGNVYLPHPAMFPWVLAFLAEAESAPGCAYWDQVDSFSQYICEVVGDGTAKTADDLAGFDPNAGYKPRDTA